MILFTRFENQPGSSREGLILLVILLFLSGEILTGCSVLPENPEPDISGRQHSATEGKGVQKEESSPTEKISQPESTQKYPSADWSVEARAFFAKGTRYLQKNPLKAMQSFNEAIVLAPTMEPAYFNLAKIAYENNDTRMLNELIQTSQQNKLQSARLLTVFAMGMRQQAKFEEAKNLYSRAIKLNNSYLPAILNRAILEDIYLGQLQTAEHYYQMYQQQLLLQGKTDKRLKNWLTDLQQRLKKQQQVKN